MQWIMWKISTACLCKPIIEFERSSVSVYFTWKAIQVSHMLFSSLATINM